MTSSPTTPKPEVLPFSDLRDYEAGIYSQSGEEGIIARIFDWIGVKHRYFVEFGAKDGEVLSNTVTLRREEGWKGLLMEGDPDYQDEAVQTEFVTAENVNDLFSHYGVPAEFDLLSIDVDGNDYWIWKAIDRFEPRVVVIEYNIFFGLDIAKTIAYRPDHLWDGTTYHGASLAAMRKLGAAKGYSLVYTESYAPNAFFIKDSELPAGFVSRPIEELTGWVTYHEPEDSAHRDWVSV
jgi:hypothetical protein